jgi:hypothetical protein
VIAGRVQFQYPIPNGLTLFTTYTPNVGWHASIETWDRAWLHTGTHPSEELAVFEMSQWNLEELVA